MSELDEYLDSLPSEDFVGNEKGKSKNESIHKKLPLAGIPGAGTATQGKILKKAIPNAISSAMLNVPRRTSWGQKMTNPKSSSPEQKFGAAIGQMAGSLVPTFGIGKAASLLGKLFASTKALGPAVQMTRSLKMAHPLVNAGVQGTAYGNILRALYSIGERGDLEDAKITKTNLIMDPLFGMAGYGLGQLANNKSKNILRRKLRNFYKEMEGVTNQSVPEMSKAHRMKAVKTGATSMLETAEEPLLRYGKKLAENPRNMASLQQQNTNLLGRMRRAVSRDIESIPGHANAMEFKENLTNAQQGVRDTGYNQYRKPFYVKSSEKPIRTSPMSNKLDKYIYQQQQGNKYPSSKQPASITGRSPNIPYTSPELPGRPPIRNLQREAIQQVSSPQTYADRESIFDARRINQLSREPISRGRIRDELRRVLPNQQTTTHLPTGRQVPRSENINAIPIQDAYEIVKQRPELKDGLNTLTNEVRSATRKSGEQFNPQSFTKHDLLNARNNIRAKLRARDYQGQSMQWLRKANDLATQMLNTHDPSGLFQNAEKQYANLALQKRLVEAGESIPNKTIQSSLKKHDLDVLKRKSPEHISALNTGIKEALRNMYQRSTGDVLANQSNIYSDVFQKSNVLNKAKDYIPSNINTTIRTNAKNFTKAYNNYKRLLGSATASTKISGKKHFSKFLTFFTRRLRYLAKAGDKLAKRFMELNSRQKLEILSRPSQFEALWKKSK
jgi:hypothetical protein